MLELLTELLTEAETRTLLGGGTGEPQGLLNVKGVHTITVVAPPRSTPWTCKRGVWAQWT